MASSTAARSAGPPQGPAPEPGGPAATAGTVFTALFGFAHLALVTNLALVVVTAPFLLVVLSERPLASWPVLVVTAPLLGPALVGAAGAFADHAADGPGAPLRAFARAWWRGLRRGLAVAALVVAALAVLVVDVVAVWGLRAGAVAVPVLVVLAVLVVVTGLVALVAVADPAGRWAGVALPRLLLVAAVRAVRRWYLAAASLAALGVLVTAVATSPVLALGLATAPVLYVVWAGCRFALEPSPAGRG